MASLDHNERAQKVWIKATMCGICCLTNFKIDKNSFKRKRLEAMEMRGLVLFLVLRSLDERW